METLKEWWENASFDQILMALSGTYLGDTETADWFRNVDARKLRLLCQAIAGRHAVHGNWHEAYYPDDPKLWLSGWSRGLAGQEHEADEKEQARKLMDEIFGPACLQAWVEVRPGVAERQFSIKYEYVQALDARRDEVILMRLDWLRWHEGAVPDLATAAYAELMPERECKRCGGKRRGVRSPKGGWVTCPDCSGSGKVGLDGALDPVRLAVLADALEEAGCDQKPVFEHLRGLGPHYRGCWALDLCLPERKHGRGYGVEASEGERGGGGHAGAGE